MNQLIPALLVHDEKTFRDRVSLMETDFPILQIDVMDGAFVPNRTWFDVNVLRRLKTSAKFELHLMVMDPGRYVEETSGYFVRRSIYLASGSTDRPRDANHARSCTQ